MSMSSKRPHYLSRVVHLLPCSPVYLYSFFFFAPLLPESVVPGCISSEKFRAEIQASFDFSIFGDSVGEAGWVFISM